MQEVQAEIDTNNELRRALNWFQLLCIGVGTTIGAGIFVLSGQAAAKYAGPSVIISFILAGIIALMASLSYSELAAMMSSCGSAYTYVYREYAAFFVGWNFGLLYAFASMTVVVAWSRYIIMFIHIVSDLNVTSAIVQAPLAWNKTGEYFFVTGCVIDLPAIALTAGITMLLLVGIRETSTMCIILFMVKITVLLIFIFSCSKYINPNNYASFIPANRGSFSKYGVTGILQGCTFVFFAHVGFESVATVAQEANRPTRSLPIALIGSTLISLFIYVGICAVMVGLVPYSQLDSNSPLAEAIKATPFGLWISILMNMGAIAGLTSVGLTCMLSQTRIMYAMAHDGLLPQIFARIQSRTVTPWISILISGLVCAVFSGVFPADILGETTSIAALINYIFVHITLIVMRYTDKNMRRTFKVPFGPWLIPSSGSLLCMLLLIGTSTATGVRFLLWTALGQIIYFSYGFWHSKLNKRSKRTPTSSTCDTISSMETNM